MKSISVTLESQNTPSVIKVSKVYIGAPKEGEVSFVNLSLA